MGAPIQPGVSESLGRFAWFRDFLKEELAPYQGRLGTVARMVIAATIVMMICITFRIPYGFQGVLYVLIISREDTRSTLYSAATILLVSAIGAGYLFRTFLALAQSIKTVMSAMSREI